MTDPRGGITVDDPAVNETASPWKNRLVYVAVASIVVVLAGLTGWLGFRAYETHRALEQREVFLRVGSQEAINLTTIDFAEADADIQRILDSSTGGFYDDFSKRGQPFADVLKQTRSKTVGTVIAAGVESSTDTSAHVLVAVTVQTSKAGAPPQPRSWRMRLTVQKTGDAAKVSNVDFVA
jgi:Mce-associated membrane protein